MSDDLVFSAQSHYIGDHHSNLFYRSSTCTPRRDADSVAFFIIDLI